MAKEKNIFFIYTVESIFCRIKGEMKYSQIEKRFLCLPQVVERPLRMSMRGTKIRNGIFP